MSDNSEPNPTQTEVTSSEQLVGLVPIEGEEHNIGVQLISGDTDEDFFGTQAIELNGERHVIVSQAQDPETGELLLVLRGENGEHIAIQHEALSSMVEASGGDNIQVSVETQEEAALTLASDISTLSQSVSTTESNPMTTSLTALPSIIANIPSQTQQTTAPTNVVQSIDTPRVSQEEQPSSISAVTTAIPPILLIESSDQTPEPTTTPSLPIEKSENPEIDVNKEEVTKELIDSSLPKEEYESKPKTDDIIPPKQEEESKEKIAFIKDKDTNLSEIVSEVEELKEKVEPKEDEILTKTDEIEDKITEPNITVESVSEILESNEIPSVKKSEELEQTIDSNFVLESTPAPEVTTTDTTLAVTSEPITTSLSIPSTASLTTSLPTTLTTTSITSETITSVSEEKVTTNTTETVNSVPELGFGNTAVIQVQDSGNDSSLEQLMANAVLTADGNYVLMAQTEDGQVTSLPSELNLSDVISAGAAGGQTFLIETPEGLVACTAATSGEDGAIQLIPTETGDIEGAVISSAQSSGSSVENQIIQAISGGQAMSYTFNSTSGCLELTAVNPTPTPTPPQKSSRGGRGSRSNKSKTTPIPSMGQTLLLTAETDTPIVATKPSTPASARNRGGGGRGKGNKITANESNSSDSTITSNTLQTKPISKTLTNEALKSSTSVKGQTPQSSAPAGPSQLAASRRTYSKKSNIVWITPDASQGANSTTFATVATASVKSKPPQNQTTTTNSISSITKTTVDTTSLSSRVRTPSPTKVTAITTAAQSASPTKTATVTPLRSSSPTKPVSVTAQDSSLTVIKPIDSKTTNKPMVTTIANKSSPQVASNDKKDTISKTTGDTTKIVTASKTVASKSSIQSSPTKGQTPDLNTQSPVTSTETAKKTTIRVSDITATKTSVETNVGKTATKTVVTVPSATKTKTSVTKSIVPTIASSTTSTAKPTLTITSSNKTISQSITKKSSIPTITTVSSVNKPISTTTTTSSTKVSTNIINSSDNKSSKIPQSVTTVPNEPNVSVATKQTKTSDSSVKSVSNLIAVKSSVSSELSSTKSTTNSSEKLIKKVSEKPVSNRSVETRHSARLSPTKSLKSDSNSKEIDSNPKITQSCSDLKESKVESLKTFTEKEVSKYKSEENESKTKNRINDIESSSTQKTQKTEETTKSEIQTQIESNESTEENKTIRKSRRSSRNTSIVDENKKEVKSIEENKIIETKTKDTKEIKDKNIKEKVKEIPVESITTRRTSRKREVINEDKTEETPTDSSLVVPTTVASTPTPTIETKSQRQTRASSGKKPDVKQTAIEENLSKTVDIKLKEKETENRVESKTESDFDRIVKETKPPEKTPEKSESVLTKPNETTTSTRSIKKRVQFEIKEKEVEENKDKEKDEFQEKVIKNLESIEKTPETSASISTRRSLRSSTPQTPINPIKNDVQSNQKEILENNSEKSEKQNIETNTKTPQRFSTRKRKEVTKSLEIEVKEVVKSPKKPKKSENDIESDVIYNKAVESSESASNARLRDRKSKSFKPKSIMKETVVRHSIETSDPFTRINRRQSLIQSFIDENEWQEKEDNLRRKTISSLSDLRSPNECYDYSTNECSFYIRHQSASLTPKQSTGNYLCQKCGFHTTRINNLVIHHRDQCSYVKNAVIQHWQTELQKRVRPSDTSLIASTSTPETKRRKTEINDELNNNLDKNAVLSDDESEEEEIVINNGKTNQNPTISDIDAMLMGSDDEDLLSIDNIEKPKREFGFSEDDIVWVETNSTHWPALVSKVFSKEKKALIRLIDSPWPKKSLKAEISWISLFDSAEVNKQYLREGRKGVNGDVLVKAVQKAEDFLRKKCLGNELSAVKFFDQIDSDLSETNADEEERLTPNTKGNISTDLAKQTAKTSNDSTQDSSLVNDGSNGDDTEDDKMPESNEAIAKWKEKRRQQNAKLLQCIKDGKVETHLVGVYRESITSERHQKFKSGSDAEKNQLKHVPWFGPIDDEEQQEEIYDYCSQLFKGNFKTDGSFDTVAYIFEVWVPEAIVKAISRVRRIELKESESIFAKGVILSQTEKDEMNKEIQKEAEKHMTSQTSSD